MAYLIFKTIISAIIIVTVSEVSKKSSLLGAILASLPLVSYLGIIWLYIDTKSKSQVAQLSRNVFWMVIPSLSFFIVFPLLLKTELNFYLSLAISTVVMVAVYFGMVFILQRFGLIYNFFKFIYLMPRSFKIQHVFGEIYQKMLAELKQTTIKDIINSEIKQRKDLI
jgi:ABC-type xylose transport system permease subunit